MSLENTQLLGSLHVHGARCMQTLPLSETSGNADACRGFAQQLQTCWQPEWPTCHLFESQTAMCMCTILELDTNRLKKDTTREKLLSSSLQSSFAKQKLQSSSSINQPSPRKLQGSCGKLLSSCDIEHLQKSNCFSERQLQ